MPDFAAHTLDLPVCRTEVEELRRFLQGHEDLPEAALRSFFRDRSHVAALIGLYNPAIRRCDRLAREYPIFGDFRCDLAIGDSVTCAHTFVELEDAGTRSLFVRQGEKATREWSGRFDHGYSQIIDWFYMLHVMTDTPDMEGRLGKRAVEYTGVLVVGRDQHIDAGEKLRLDWRSRHTIVNSKRIVCVTYDQLLEDLSFRLDRYVMAAKVDD